MKLEEKIMQFQVDCNGDKQLFINKLSKQNSWSIFFSERAFFEYKRFIYLAALGHHRVVPSKIIDTVWHLHLTFTQSYWNDLCGVVLKKQIHHMPSSLSFDSKTRDFEDYNDTVILYKKIFQSDPPADCWRVVQKKSPNYWFVTFIFASTTVLTACTAVPNDEAIFYIKWGIGLYAGYRILKWLGLGKGGGSGGGCGSDCSGGCGD